MGLKLDLGCGNRAEEGYQGVDINPSLGDIHVDLEKYPWPWEDNSVETVRIHHFIEHVHDVIPFMEELWRVCQDKALVKVVVPYWTSSRAWQDPTHVRGFTEASFLYYNQEWLKREKLEYYTKANFIVDKVGFQWHPDFEGKAEAAQMFALSHYVNAVLDMYVELIAAKG